MSDEREADEKRPAVFGFVRTIACRGLEDPDVRERIKALSYMDIAALRHHPKFQDLLAGIVLKRALLGDKIPTDMRWALKYLTSRDSGSDFNENGDDIGTPHFTPKTSTPITVQPLDS